jgi:hypothetical protein
MPCPHDGFDRLRWDYTAGGGNFLHFVVGGLVLDAEAQQHGAFDMLDREFFGQGVPEMVGALGAAVGPGGRGLA